MRKSAWKKCTAGVLSGLMLATAFPAGVQAEETAEQASQGETLYGEKETVEISSEKLSGRGIDFNSGWRFSLGDSGQAQNPGFDDSSWEKVTLPHDYSIIQDYTTRGEAESGFLPGGTGWYRKSFTMDEGTQDKTVILNFDGVYSDAYLYVNGEYAGEHHYGYTPFSFDISSYLICDGTTENVIAVKCVNNVPSSRWYSGSGIYRDVTVDVVDDIHVSNCGVSVTTPDIVEGKGTVSVSVSVDNQSDEAAEITVVQEVYNNSGDKVAEGSSDRVHAGSGEAVQTDTEMTVDSPDLWSVDEPVLYTLKSQVLQNGEVVDTEETVFGFRYYEFDPDTGFSLNGQRMKLNGVCLHHDQGAAGSAAYDDAIYRQLVIMKDMGVNAVRTSHNPADEDFIRYCNELGILVIEEAFDTWAYPKNGNNYDYSRYFSEMISEDNTVLGAEGEMTWAEFDIQAMVNRDKNAPSVILWSLGNEIQEGLTGADTSSYPEIAQNLIDWIEEVDPTRPCTFGDNQIKNNNSVALQVAQVIHDNGGVVGLNYCSDGQNSSAHSKNPEWRLYGAETSSAINSRGVYYTRGQDSSKLQMTSYDDTAVSWGMTAHESLYNTLSTDYIAGEFVWTGFDYLGEPTPWNGTWTGSVSGQGAVPNSSYFGIVDTAGFAKDTYYLYRSQWNQDSSTLHLVTAWDEDNQLLNSGKTPVVIYSNAPVVKLYLNGEQIGTAQRKENVTEAGFSYYTYDVSSENRTVCTPVNNVGSETLYAEFSVTYEAGTISAEAYDEDGNKIEAEAGKTSVSTPGEERELKASASCTEQEADGQSLVYIEVDLTDGINTDTAASDPVAFIVEGEGEILGVDNGNPATTDKYQQSSVKESDAKAQISAFHGKALAIVRTTENPGDIKVTVSADGYGTKSISLKSVPVSGEETEDGITSYTIVRDYSVKEGTVPELISEAEVSMADGNTRKGTVEWQEITSEMYNTSGDYTISGTLTAGDMTVAVSARLHVIADVCAMLNYATATTPGVQPDLPAVIEGVKADGTVTGEFAVKWSDTEVSRFENPGDIVEIEGTAVVFGEETLPVKASIRVAEEVQTESSNVASQYLKLTEDCTYTSDNLYSIVDGITDDGADEDARWTNYNNRNVSDQATVTFTWATAQLLGSVNLYFFTDSYSAALPEEVKIEASLDGNNFSEVDCTHTELVGYNEGATIYTFDAPINPVALRITLTQQSGRCVGLTEAQIMTYAASLEYQESAVLSGLKINGEELEGFSQDQMEYECETESITNVEIEPVIEKHAAVTILPIQENVVRILVSAENRLDLKIYELTLTESTVEKQIPEASFTASKGSDGKIRLTGKFEDYINQDNYYEVESHGLVYYSSKKLGTKLLTVNTAGRTKINFGSYQEDGTFSYEMKPSYSNTLYTVRAYLQYRGEDGRLQYVYSTPVRVSYDTVQ